MKLTRWMYWTFACSALFALSACASASAPMRAATGWTERIAAEVNPHLALLEGQTRGATEAECVPGPVWATSVPEERRLKPRIEILEFTDFECPFCVRVQGTLDRVLEHFGPCTVRITTVPKPLPMHPGARDGAIVAARAAQDGPQAHARMHRALFEASEGLSAEQLKTLAKDAGLTESDVEQALEDPELAAFVDWGVYVGDHGDARGTPTFYVNGHMVRGAQSFDTFSEIIEGELQFSRDREGRWGDRWLTGRLALNAPVVYALMLEGRRITELPGSEEEEVLADQEEEELPKELEIHQVDLKEGDPIRGKASAPVTIVTFSDFECHYCAKLDGTLAKVREYYGEQVRFVAKQYPLAFHKTARPAARAALCAQEQDAYWPYHDGLYEFGARFRESDLFALAEKLKLNTKKLKRCMSKKKTDGRVDADMAQGEELGVAGTPVSFVNGFKINGAAPFSHFKALIDAALGPEAER